MKYTEFLESKIISSPKKGIEIGRDEVHESLFPHQKDIVVWALKGGRRAIFAAFGLGKTLIQLELMRQIVERNDCLGLIICPLGVQQEFKRDAGLLGIDRLQYVTNTEEALNAGTPYLLTNYERVRDGGFDLSIFGFSSLDEASVLRSYGSKTYQTFIEIFQAVPFRYVCTATPAPNRYKELIHYAGFLGVMDTGQALTRFFQRDSTKANNLTLYPHKEKEFWIWMAAWSIFITKPSDFGYSDDGYILPPVKIKWHCLPVDHNGAGADSWGQMKLLKDDIVRLQDSARAKRETLDRRIKKMVEIIEADTPNKHWICWHDLEKERKAIERVLSDEYEEGKARSIWGSQKIENRERNTIDFFNGEFRILATKPSISGSGCNFQNHCHSMIFLGIGYKFNDFIQAIHRVYRFMQKNEVEVHIIYSENEENIRKALEGKWKRYDELTEVMVKTIQKYGLNNTGIKELKRTIGVKRQVESGELFTAVNNDCVDETARMEGDSVHFICTSIPFNNHYEYTPSYNDFGHTEDVNHFFEQMDYLSPELFRVLQPGRIMAVHVKNRVRFGNVTGLGFPTIEPFSHRTVFHYIQHGFKFIGEIIVLTDVVRENNQTYRLGWTENSKDSTKMGVGCPEYILLFRKPQSDLSKGYADVPVTKDKTEYTRKQWQIDAHAFWRSKGNRFLSSEELAEMDLESVQSLFKSYSAIHVYDYEEHVNMGKGLEENGRLPAKFMLFAPQSHSEWIFDDIVRMRTLNSDQTRRKVQNHICPLQIDLVERLINRYTNEGELVYDPFAGIYTVPHCAVKMNRKGYGTELNSQYWFDGVQYLKAAEYKMNVPTLFDLIEL